MSSSKIETITPAMATAWLERNVANRNIRERVVAKYTQDMKAGRWMVNGESIKFDVRGNIADGQHRLWAVVNSGATIQSYVVRDLPVEAFHTIDQGAARNAADVLFIAGNKNTACLAAVLRMLYFYDTFGGDLFPMRTSRVQPTTQELLKTLEEHIGVDESVHFLIGRKRLRAICGNSSGAFCHYLFNKKSPIQTNTFFDSLLTGAGLEAGNPILALRNRLTSENDITGPFASIARSALIIKTWNCIRLGKEMKLCKLNSDEQFPRIL